MKKLLLTTILFLLTLNVVAAPAPVYRAPPPIIEGYWSMIAANGTEYCLEFSKGCVRAQYSYYNPIACNSENNYGNAFEGTYEYNPKTKSFTAKLKYYYSQDESEAFIIGGKFFPDMSAGYGTWNNAEEGTEATFERKGDETP